jgi:hypothetical protein
MNNTLARAKQNRPRLLISGLRLDKAHFRLTSLNDDCSASVASFFCRTGAHITARSA